jgi:alkylation response protein AidB-like acyl-CoA dehydrogenase
VQVTPIRTMLGDSGFNSVFFDDARTSADNVLGPPGAGWAAAMTTLGHERATSVLNYQFSFVREMRELRALAQERSAADDVVLRDRLIDAYVGLKIMGYNNMRSLTRALTDGQFGPEASIGKYYWSRWHQSFTELAMDVLGPDSLLGTCWDTGPDRASTGIRRAFVRARAETIYAGTSEIQKNIISERMLGMPREPKRAGP